MKIGIIGVGNIGMRYVQGIGSAFPDAQLVLVDSAARLKALETQVPGHAMLARSLDEVDDSVDLFVVATSCEPRLAIYKQCLERAPRCVILEKYLFASREQFDECLALERVPTFVNQWMFGSNTFACLFERDARSVEVIGSGWGLACNAVHWIDVFKRHMKISDLRVGDGTVVSRVFASKRAGYEEINGELVFEDPGNGKTIRLVDQADGEVNAGLTIKVDDSTYFFDYSKVSRGDEVLSRFPYFSSVIGAIVSEMLGDGGCSLPLLEESVSQHLLIEDVLETLDRRPRIT